MTTARQEAGDKQRLCQGTDLNQYKDIIQARSCDLCRRAGLSLSEEAGNWASRPDCEGKSSITSLLSQSGLTTVFQVTLNLRGAFCGYCKRQKGLLPAHRGCIAKCGTKMHTENNCSWHSEEKKPAGSWGRSQRSPNYSGAKATY